MDLPVWSVSISVHSKTQSNPFIFTCTYFSVYVEPYDYSEGLWIVHQNKIPNLHQPEDADFTFFEITLLELNTSYNEGKDFKNLVFL